MFLNFQLGSLFKREEKEAQSLFALRWGTSPSETPFKQHLSQVLWWVKLLIYSFSFLMICWSFFQSMFTSYVAYSKEPGEGLEAGYSPASSGINDHRYVTIPWTPNPWAYWPLIDSRNGFGPFIMWLVYPFSRAFLHLIWTFKGDQNGTLDTMGFNVIFAILIVLLTMKFIVFFTTFRAQYYSDKQQRHKRNVALINAKYETVNDKSWEWRQSGVLRQKELSRYNKRHGLKPLAPLENFFINTPIFLIVFRLMTITRPVKYAKLFGVMPLSKTPAQMIFSDFAGIGWMYLLFCLIIIPVNFFNQRFPTMLMRRRFPDYAADSNLSFRNINLGSSKKIQNIMTVVFLLFSFFWSTSLGIYYFFNSLLNILSNFLIHLILKRFKSNETQLTKKLRTLGIET
ncbi:inner membrane protein translocase component YidC [Candidatus Mycoplasma haematolamae str. Purdue]|uniref:Inner membrane protein translocase component YidC n=1 Tax=Mycoplasma haematolamae (strain Purdue) TaxID=1212765 RepID=I7BKR7_MYCHA|nr:YidC/Oxa1 family membrane protein insertase [Candidatus Mycoplasma haematolamae]AFO52503.1 inner membrane protein translocase component YidC [Candidatus Mycoplasma haematolamae str. Purdue]